MTPPTTAVAYELHGLPSGSTEDRELAEAFKRGEEGAYQLIYERYERRVQGVCRRMLGPGEDASEAAQDTFLRIYQALPRFNGRYQLGAWITRIATNVCLDQLRARSRKPSDLTPFDEIETEPLLSDPEADPEAVHIRNHESRRVRRVLSQLPPMHRAAIVLRDFEGLSYAEVAIALQITECQTKALIHRARQNFKRSWASSIASILIPTRLLERLRGLDGAPRDQAAQIATSGGQVAASCNAILASCGQFVTEKVGGVAVAAVMGTAAVSSAAVAVTPVLKPAPQVEASSQEQAQVLSRAVTKPEHEQPPPRQSEGQVSEEDPGAPQQAQPVNQPVPASSPMGEPTPSATPSSQPSPSPVAPASPAPSPSPTVVPEPQGTSFAFTTDKAPSSSSCTGCRPDRLLAESVRPAGTSTLAFSQSFEGSATFKGTPSYGLDVSHQAEGRAHEVRFTLTTAEGTYRYAASGLQVFSGSTSWGGRSFTYEGTFNLGTRPTRTEAVPESGSYRLVVEYSGRQTRLVSTTFVLTEGN